MALPPISGSALDLDDVFVAEKQTGGHGPRT